MIIIEHMTAFLIVLLQCTVNIVLFICSAFPHTCIHMGIFYFFLTIFTTMLVQWWRWPRVPTLRVSRSVHCASPPEPPRYVYNILPYGVELYTLLTDPMRLIFWVVKQSLCRCFTSLKWFYLFPGRSKWVRRWRATKITNHCIEIWRNSSKNFKAVVAALLLGTRLQVPYLFTFILSVSEVFT